MLSDRYYQDIKVGDKVEFIETEDVDLLDWISDNNITTFIISSLCNESELVWTEDCPYGIAMADILLVRD